jgi:creatinine amidohydrolase
MSAYLERLTWIEAEKLLTPQCVVLIPLGAAAKEHGPHLRLDNDRTLAEYLARRVADVADVIVAPTIAHHYYPAFVEYPGSTTLRLETARDLVVDVVSGLAAFGGGEYRTGKLPSKEGWRRRRRGGWRRLKRWSDRRVTRGRAERA